MSWWSARCFRMYCSQFQEHSGLFLPCRIAMMHIHLFWTVLRCKPGWVSCSTRAAFPDIFIIPLAIFFEAIPPAVIIIVCPVAILLFYMERIIPTIIASTIMTFRLQFLISIVAASLGLLASLPPVGPATIGIASYFVLLKAYGW